MPELTLLPRRKRFQELALDSLGDSEVLLGDRAIRYPRVGQRVDDLAFEGLPDKDDRVVAWVLIAGGEAIVTSNVRHFLYKVLEPLSKPSRPGRALTCSFFGGGGRI